MSPAGHLCLEEHELEFPTIWLFHMSDPHHGSPPHPASLSSNWRYMPPLLCNVLLQYRHILYVCMCTICFLCILVALMKSTLAEFTDSQPSISKQIYSTYLSHITNLSRRFFHLLLRWEWILVHLRVHWVLYAYCAFSIHVILNIRYKRLEKAFQLAEEIGAKDLFMVSLGGYIMMYTHVNGSCVYTLYM